MQMGLSSYIYFFALLKKGIPAFHCKLPRDYFCDYVEYASPLLLMELAQDQFKCSVTRIQNEDGGWTLQAARFATMACREPNHILITIPQIGICERTSRVSMTTHGAGTIWFRDDAETVRYDYAGWNEVDDRYELYYDDELTAWIRYQSFRVCGRVMEEPSGPEIRLVTVRFKENGRTYDYICDFENINVGDTVIVDGYDGETTAAVIGIRIKKESELGLPAERYKKIVRKNR